MKKRRSKFEIYSDNLFENCPCCRSNDIIKEEAIMDESCYDTYRSCRCYHCGALWNEDFEITGILINKKGKKCKR